MWALLCFISNIFAFWSDQTQHIVTDSTIFWYWWWRKHPHSFNYWNLSTHNRLLLQHCPLKVTLLPKLCCYGQSNLKDAHTNTQTLNCRKAVNTQLATNLIQCFASHLALHLPRLGDSWQVTCGHHHSPEDKKGLEDPKSVTEQRTTHVLVVLTWQFLFWLFLETWSRPTSSHPRRYVKGPRSSGTWFSS